jgi:ASC-1-like (ASCH) protein
MEYHLYLNPRPFEAIKNGIKKIEGRVPVNHDAKVSFDKFKTGDTIIFTNPNNEETIKVKVSRVSHYKNVKLMLETEGTRNVLSSKGTIKQGIESYNNLEGYKKGIIKYGIYAIEISLIL